MLKLTEDFTYNKKELIAVTNTCDVIQRYYLEKTFSPLEEKDHYFIKAYVTVNDKTYCIGYIYSYLDFKNRESRFIGIYVKEECRHLGVGMNLMACWLNICWENNFNKITTNKKQRKPFLIFMLKKFGFEIEEPEKYELSPFTVYICKKMNCKKKYLLFKNESQKASFITSPIFLGDNYIVLSEQSKKIPIIDNILLSTPYHLQDTSKAEAKVTKQVKCLQIR